jgi:hypothetical protein
LVGRPLAVLRPLVGRGVSAVGCPLNQRTRMRMMNLSCYCSDRWVLVDVEPAFEVVELV